MSATYKEQQIEALTEMVSYEERLIPGLYAVITELTEERKEDTDEFLVTLINGMNWVFQIVNHTLDLLNEKEADLDKEKINDAITIFTKAKEEKNDEAIANAISEYLIPILQRVQESAKLVLEG
ncbi:MAG: molecular chaperone [Lachnospiraceae bacterium]|nr:molecular chaperone [Lachnospiraceae bacterium]MEE1341340.1 molecular chaperone [Lachnospiraceae bacterium]